MSDFPKPVRQAIVDNFIAQLKSGASPFTSPFEAGQVPPPVNGVTGKAYAGLNRLILSESGATDPRWLTKKQAEAQGYQVKDQAQPRRLIYWEYTQEVPVYNPDGSPRLNNIGRQVQETVRRDRPLMRTCSVYQARDLMTLDGRELPPYEPPTINNDPLDRVSAMLANSGATIRHTPSPSASRSQSGAEVIVLPERDLVTEEEYYAQAVKALVSWAGHPDRLGRRPGLAGGGQQLQGQLRDTLAGAMIAQDLGIKFEPEVDSRIIGQWVKALENDPGLLFRAAAQADSIRLHVMGLEQTRVQDLEDRRRDRPSQEYYAHGFRPAGPEDKPEQGAWIRASDDQATVFAVVSGRDDSIVSTFDNREASLTEANALKLGVKPALKYSGEVVRLEVPFEEKDMVKALGATWDRRGQVWCARPGVELSKLGRWLPDQELSRSDLVEPDLNDRLALEVPYQQRQEAKDLGAFFDDRQGAWVTSVNNINLDELTKRFPPKLIQEVAAEHIPDLAAVPEIATERVALAVPFAEKHLAKAAGAKWDRDEKVWMAEPGTDLARLSQWIPEREPEPEKVLAAVEEFAKVLQEAGFQLEALPNMDGKIYRVPVLDGRPNSKDGAYYAAMNGDRPNGWLKNHRSGEHRAWTYSGQEMTAAGKEAQKEQAAARRRAREDKAESLSMAKWATGLNVAREFAEQIEGIVPTTELLKNPFLEVAGINAVGGVRRDDDGNLMVPGVNIEGRLQTVQTIKPNGVMRFEKGDQRSGAMCLIDGFEIISTPNPETGLPVFRPEYTDHGDESLNRDLLIAEDFATGASLHMATGLPVAVAFSPDNLVKVAADLHQKYPEANLLVCANDHPERAFNLSRKRAEEAARKVGGRLAVPEFNELGKRVGLATFNDLHKTSGLEAVTRAINQARQQGHDRNAGMSR